MNICVQQLFIHPVKGLSPQKCDRTLLQVGHGIPGDRAFALMYKEDTTGADATVVPWMKKQNFAMQNDWSGLAVLDCFYDPDTGTLTVKRLGVELLVADTLSPTGRDRIATFFTGYLAGIYPSQSARHPNRAPLQFVGEFDKTRYPDREAVHISLIGHGVIITNYVSVSEAIFEERASAIFSQGETPRANEERASLSITNYFDCHHCLFFSPYLPDLPEED